MCAQHRPKLPNHYRDLRHAVRYASKLMTRFTATYPWKTVRCEGKQKMLAGSWQEMAAVLDMLQDISIPSGNSQLGRPFSAMSPATSPQRQPRCTSVTSSPDYVSSAAHRKPRCASALSPLSPLQAGSEQAGVVPRQQFSHDVMSPLATSRSRTPNGKIRGSPLSACGSSSHRQDWQS